MNNDIQSKQFQQFYKALKKGSWTGKDKTLEEALIGNIRFEQHKESDEAGRIVERIKVAKSKTVEERETFAKHNTANTSNVVEMIQKYMEQQLKTNVNKLYRMKEEADKILDAELNKITIQYGTKINKNTPTNLKADIVKAANASKKSVKGVVGKMTVGKTGKTYNEAEEYSRFLRDYLGEADVILSTRDEIKKMLLELYDNSEIYLGDDFEAEISNIKKEKVSNEKVQQIVNEKMKSYNGKKKDKNKYKNKLINETTASEKGRVEADYNNNVSSAKEQAFEKYHGNLLEAAYTYELTEDTAFTAAKSQIIQSVADGKSKAPTDIKFEDYSEKIEKTKQNINELELEMAKAVDIIVERQLDHTNGVFANVGAEFRNLAEKMKTGSITDKDKKKVQKEISLIDKNRKDDIKKLDNTYRSEQRSLAGIGRKSKEAMQTDKLALENKKKPHDDLRSRYADHSVLESSDLITQNGTVRMEVAKKLFGDSKMTQKDERISGKEKVEQIKKDAETYKKLQEKPFTDEDQNELDKVNSSLNLLEQIEKTIREGDYEAIKAYNEQSKAIIELLTHYEKIDTDIDEKKNVLSEVTDKQNEANTLVNATQAPENIAKQEEKVSSIMATKNEAEGNVLGFGEHIQQMMKHFGSYMLRLRLVQRGIQDIVDTIGEFQKIDDEAFQLGMVSDMNINSIKRYRNEVLMLATNYRTTAEEILNTQSEIIKTGRTFDQAKQQVNASLILSKATFESLGDAGALLNKMMLGLEISGDKSYETMNKLYNVIQATPQSLAGLDAAMRQSGSAFSGLIDTISYSGSQLDDYKDGLAETQMSLLGLVSLQGKTPMMAGTAVKTLIDKMRGPTDKALRTVNTELSLKKATDSNGNAITMRTIQNLTETDFTKAIELLSKLHKEGILSYQSIQDLFGPRNAATISKLLNQVNGDLEAVNEELLTRRDVLKDSEKLDSSWSQEMEELKNSFRALKGVANDFGDSLKPAVKILRQGMSGIADWAGNTDIGKSTVQTISAGMTLGSIAKNGYYSLIAGSQAARGNGAAMMGLGDDQHDIAQTAFLISSLGGNMRGLSESAGKAGGATALFSKSIGNFWAGLVNIVKTPLTWWLLGIAAAIALIGTLYIRHKRLEGEINQSIINLEENSEKSKIALASLEENFDGLGKSLASITPTMFAASNGMNLLEDATKSLLDSLIEYTNKISGLNLELIKQGKIKEADAVLKNDKSSDSDRKRAKITKKILEKTDVPSLSRDELLKGTDLNTIASEFIKSPEKFKKTEYDTASEFLYDLMHISGEGLTAVGDQSQYIKYKKLKVTKQKAQMSLQKQDPDAITSVLDYAKVLYGDSNAADIALEFEVKADLYKSIIDSSAQYETSLVDAFNRDIGIMKDIKNRITDITSGHQKNVLTKNNSKLLDKTILNMVKYDKKLADVIKEKYDSTNIFQTMEYEDAMEILNQQVLLKEARDRNKKNRNRYNSINGVSIKDNKKMALQGNVFTAITDTETELKKDNLKVDNDTLTTIFTGNEKESTEALESIKNAESKEITEKKLEAYKKSHRYGKGQLYGVVTDKYTKDYEKDSGEIVYKKLSKLASVDDRGNLLFSLLVELAEKDIDKYNEVMKKFSEDARGNAKKSFDAMQPMLTSVIGAMQFQKSEEPVLDAAVQFQEIINKMIRTGADKIKRIEASLGIVEGQINSSGEYASFSNRSKAASKRMDLTTAQNQQEYVENMVKQVPIEEYAKNSGLTMAYNDANLNKNRAIFMPIETKDIADFSQWLYKPENAKFLKQAQNELAAGYKKEASAIMTTASKLTPKEIEAGKKNGYSIDAKVLAEANRQRGAIDKYLGDLSLTDNDITKAILSVTDEANKRSAMAALGESKYIKDSDIAAIPNFIGEIYNIRGKIDEAAYKYSKVYGTDVTEDIKYGTDNQGNKSTATTDAKRLEEINEKVAKIKAKSQEEINKKENKDLLKYYAEEKAKIEERIKIKNSINQIELDELNRIRQFYIELQKASYDFNRSIGYGVQFADMNKVTSALIDKRNAETTISQNRDKILENQEVDSIQYDSKDQKYKVYDKKGKVMADELFKENLKNINDAYKKYQKASIDIDSYKNYKKDAVADEIGIQTKTRDMYQYLGDNSDTGKYKRKQAQRELDIETANLFETLFDDINKSLSDLPSVQLIMLENQKQMKKNELEIWKTQEDSAKKTLETGKLKAEIATKEIEIAKYQLEIKKQIIEKEKNIFELQNQRYEMLGIHKYSPQEKYLRDVNNAKDVFKLSSEELNIEERRAKLSIENTDAIKELTVALWRNIITEDGKSEEYKNHKEDAKKKNGKNFSYGDAKKFASIEEKNIAFKKLYKEEEDAKKKPEIDTTDTKRIMTLKQVETIEQYITSLYKARMDYIDNISKKYEGIVTGATALITGDKSKIKYDKPDLTKSIFTTYGAAKEFFNRSRVENFTDEEKELIGTDEKWNNLMDSKGNEEYSKLDKMNDINFEKWLSKQNKTYKDEYDKGKGDPNIKRGIILKKKEEDGFKDLMAQAAVQTLVGVFDVINEASVNKLKLELAGLQHEQRILEMRKSGYRTEYAKYNMDKHIQANKRKQIEKESKIAEKEKEAQNGALFGSVGQGLLSSGEPHAMAAGAALMILQKPLGKLFDDGSAKIEKERKLAEFNTEESFKEYGMFWDRFFKVIEKMTSYAEQKIESMTSDYNKSRNLTRRNKTISQIREEAQIITDSVNDFEAIASATKTVKTKTWYGKKKKSDVTTDWNFSMDNLNRDHILNYANMTDEQLKAVMVDEAKKDNANAEGKWNVTDEALYDFRKSLQDASEAINYLDRMISDSNLSNKEFYGNLEGFGVEKETDIKNQFNEQIASALAAGDTATAAMLTSMRDSEVKRFKDSGVTEIYYSTFSQIMYEAAEKVAEDTGNFSDAFATGIGSMIGTTFRNTIDEIMKRGIVDNSYLDEWATKFYDGMKTFTGNLSNFINDGVLDLNALSEAVGAGSIQELLSNKSEWDKMSNINIYRTSSNLASQLRSAGLDEVSIGKILESAGLKDILKDAVNEIADIFNPVGLSSAKLKMKRESFESDNGRRAEEIRRKQLLGTASAGELKELDNIENGYLKLSIEENVYNGFKSGIESAIKETTYTNIFNKFGSMIGDAISKTALKNLNLDNAAEKVANLLTAGNYAEAGKEIRNISLTTLAVAKQNEETAKKLRKQGLDWTEIYGTGLVPNMYQDVTNELSSQNSLKNVSAKYKKSEIDFSNTMATDKYNNSEYYNELMNRKARGDFISENETIWIEQYESSLTNITNKQNLLNSLQSSFNSMLSNKTGLDYLKQVSQSIGQTIDEMIMQKIKVDFTMESLIEKIVGGKNANKEIAELSKVYKSAKSTQELIKNQMISNGTSYSLIEQMFGEDAASTIADVYSEMQNYSNTLGRISYQEENYKKEVISVNGVLFQYDEYYRELNLKKANGITLTESEITWINRYTDTMKKFETNKKVVTEFYSAVGQAFNSEDLLKSFSSFADSFNNILKEKIVDGYLSNELSNDMANMINIAQNALSTGTVSDLYSAQKQMMAFSAKIQTAKNQTQGLIDMFDSSKIIDFTDKTKDITYNASSSKETVYNITQNLSVSAGAVIGDGVSLDKLAKTLAPYLSKELKKY